MNCRLLLYMSHILARFGTLHQVAKGKGKASAAAAVKTAPSASNAEVDKFCPKAGNPGVSVCGGYDAKLNQTNIANNNNKFYVLQVRLG